MFKSRTTTQNHSMVAILYSFTRTCHIRCYGLMTAPVEHQFVEDLSKFALQQNTWWHNSSYSLLILLPVILSFEESSANWQYENQVSGHTKAKSVRKNCQCWPTRQLLAPKYVSFWLVDMCVCLDESIWRGTSLAGQKMWWVERQWWPG